MKSRRHLVSANRNVTPIGQCLDRIFTCFVCVLVHHHARETLSGTLGKPPPTRAARIITSCFVSTARTSNYMTELHNLSRGDISTFRSKSNILYALIMKHFKASYRIGLKASEKHEPKAAKAKSGKRIGFKGPRTVGLCRSADPLRKPDVQRYSVHVALRTLP